MQHQEVTQHAANPSESATQYPSIHINGHQIPIDPVLTGIPFDPAFLAGENEDQRVQTPPPPTPLIEEPRQYSEPLRQYSQGPQGDPFAPPPPPFLPIPIEQSPPRTTSKKKRKTRKPNHCGICDSSHSPELMVSCIECGRKDHTSCISAEVVGDVVRSYPWRCSDCKICEVCLNKGDEAKMVFCDHCDRGWHQDCLNPPLEETPHGNWHCPECPSLDIEMIALQTEALVFTEPPVQMDDPMRGSSVASSSRHRSKPSLSIFTEESEAEVKVPPTRRQSKKTYKKRAVKEESVLSSDQEVAPTPVKSAKTKRQRVQSPDRPLPRIRLRLPAQKWKGKEREPPESPKGMFNDILPPEDRDTTKTTITAWDKQQFERSRQVAEEKLAPSSEVPATPVAGPSRPLRSAAMHSLSIPMPTTPASPTPSTPGAKVPAFPSMKPNALRIRTIRFGPFDVKTWYDAPFPEEYASIPDGRLWICEFCLKYMKSRLTAGRHKLKCKARHPPGDEIYRDGAISVFEVDGRKNKIYCQQLCLLSKMFLDHKSLFYDVEPFLFYVITEADEFGAHFVGYFSKEKQCLQDYNLSCIMTLPVRQRQGWGNFLIDFSYLLSKKEKRTGSPEKPLSALGAIGYRNYWTLAIMRFLDTVRSDLRLEDISNGTSMTIEDVYNTLVQQNMITTCETTPSARPSPGQSIKYPKGRRAGVARRALQRTQTQDDDVAKGPFVPPKSYRIHWDQEKVSSYLTNWEGKGYLRLKPEKLKWTPFLVSRAELLTPALEDGPSRERDGKEERQSEASTNAPRGESTSSRQAGSPEAHSQNDTLPVHSPLSSVDGSRGPPLSIDTGQSSSPPPIPPTLSRRRTRSQYTPSPSTPSPSTSRPRVTRSSSRRVLSHNSDDILAEDEALAALLQDEEQRPRRQLRSRQDSSIQPPRLSPTPAKSFSLKRKRIESPEDEDDIEYDMPSEATLTPHLHVNGSHKQENVSETSSPVFTEPDQIPTYSNGLSQHTIGPGVNGLGQQGIACTASDLDIATVLVSLNNSAPVRTNGTDLKPEGTKPVVPITDQVTAQPHLNGAHVDVPIFSPSLVIAVASMPSEAEAKPVDSDIMADTTMASPTPVKTEVSVGAIPDQSTNMEVEDEYGDEDADGEYEEDAEGEPDDELLGISDTAGLSKV
ncbi:MYST (SAS/MOZ) family protein [Pleurotus pulmonarius]